MLLVEDNADDAELCQRLLRKTYPEIRCDVVQTQQEFTRQLRSSYYDVILSDYSLGQWTSVDAFDLMRKAARDIPFILITGALNDSRAIECVKSGITDYILKDNPERLPFAISRALEERQLLQEHKRAKEALSESEAQFRMLAESISAAAFIERDTQCSYANPPAERLTGYGQDELTRMNFWGMVDPESRNSVIEKLIRQVDQDHVASRYELRILTKQRSTRWLDVTIGTFQP